MTTMQTKLITAVNGVDLTRLTETVEAVKAAPELGRFKFRIQNRWIGGEQNRSKVQQFSAGGKETQHMTELTLEADEPDVLLGTDVGANPVEHLLHALASCVTTSCLRLTRHSKESTLQPRKYSPSSLQKLFIPHAGIREKCTCFAYEQGQYAKRPGSIEKGDHDCPDSMLNTKPIRL